MNFELQEIIHQLYFRVLKRKEKIDTLKVGMIWSVQGYFDEIKSGVRYGKIKS